MACAKVLVEDRPRTLGKPCVLCPLVLKGSEYLHVSGRGFGLGAV